MDQKPSSASVSQTVPHSNRRGGVLFMALVFIVCGVVVGAGLTAIIGRARQSARLKQEREQLQSLYAKAAPRAETQLTSLEHQLDALQNELSQANFAERSSAIRTDVYAAHFRRAESQINAADDALKPLFDQAEEMAKNFPATTEVLQNSDATKLAELEARLDNARSNLAALANDLDFVRQHHSELIRTELDNSRRAQDKAETQVEIVRQAQADASERAQLETIRSVQAEATQAQFQLAAQTEAGANTRAQNDLIQRAVFNLSQPQQPILAAYPVVTYPSTCLTPTYGCEPLLSAGFGYGYNRAGYSYNSSCLYPYRNLAAFSSRHMYDKFRANTYLHTVRF